MKLCERLEPRPLGKEGIEVLNEIHGKRMKTIPKLRLKKEGKDWIVTV